MRGSAASRCWSLRRTRHPRAQRQLHPHERHSRRRGGASGRLRHVDRVGSPATTNTTVSPAPSRAAWAELLERGVNVTLGVDAAKIWTFGDMGRIAYLVARQSGGYISCERLFEMQTIGAARAAGLEREIGSLEPGKRADIVIRSPDLVEGLPALNPVMQALMLSQAFALGRNRHLQRRDSAAGRTAGALRRGLDPCACPRFGSAHGGAVGPAGRHPLAVRWPRRQCLRHRRELPRARAGSNSTISARPMGCWRRSTASASPSEAANSYTRAERVGQVDPAGADRRADRTDQRTHQHRRPGRDRPAAGAAQRGLGVPELCAVPQHDGGGQRGVPVGGAWRAARRGGGQGGRGVARWSAWSGWRRRRPSELSGGQQQRVALARAMVFRPDILLLDEPLSALDRKLRDEVRDELNRLQRAVGITTVLVTHDQEEALSLSDRIVVLEAGRVRQIDPPALAYRRPRSRFVAEFLGLANFFEGRLRHGPEGCALATADGLVVALPHAPEEDVRAGTGDTSPGAGGAAAAGGRAG